MKDLFQHKIGYKLGLFRETSNLTWMDLNIKKELIGEMEQLKIEAEKR